MTQQNQAGQDAGAGEVFVECIEKARLPDFGFSRHGEIGAWLSQRRLPKQKNDAPKIKFVSLQFWAIDCEKSSLNRSASDVHSNDSGKPKREILEYIAVCQPQSSLGDKTVRTATS